MKLIEKIISIVVLLSFAFGTYFFIDNRYALAENVNQIEKRLDQKISSDRYSQTQQRIWTLDDRYKDKTKMPKSVQEEYRELQDQKQKLQDELKSMDKK
jgi:septal ring factor EnvC (AmiA/AmiB activator)